MSTHVLPPGAVAVPRTVRRSAVSLTSALRTAWQWSLSHPETFLVVAVLGVVGAAHGINMFHFPYYEDDEGTYMSQAWAIVHEGRLAPYTYWYDHAPGGWMQIALWTMLTGGFHTFGNSIDTGRVFIWVLMVISAGLQYGIARRLTGSRLVAVMAVLLFSLTAYGGYFQRRVLLDNITTPWMLLSILLLLSPRLSLQKVWLSALALSISILSKEVTAFLVPAMTYLMLVRVGREQRLFATVGWLALVGSMLSQYVLMAALNSELFPTGTLLGGTANHVSLLGSLSYQAGRSKDGGLFDLHSSFWQVARGWIRDEPLLVVGGTISAGLEMLVIRWERLIGIMGLLTFSLWAFMARGGVVIEFYLVPLLPLLALNVALAFWLLVKAAQHLVHRPSTWLKRGGYGLRLVGAIACLSGLLLGYMSPDRGFAGNHLLLWTSTQADAQTQALNWMLAHVPTRSYVIMDNYAYVDLHDGSFDHADEAFPHADYYWKLDEDPAIKLKIYHDQWQRADYLLYTIQMHTDMLDAHLTLTRDIYRHSVTLAHFDTGGWPVDIRKVIKPGVSAPNTALPTATRFMFLGGSTTKHTNSTLSLLNPGTLPTSGQLTFLFSDGTVIQRGISIDASSRKAVKVSSLQPHSGSFALLLQTNRPIAGYLERIGATSGPTLITAQTPALRWTLRGVGPGSRILRMLNTSISHPTRVQIADNRGHTRVLTLGPRRIARLALSPAWGAQLQVSAAQPVLVQTPGQSMLTAVKGGQFLKDWTLNGSGCQADLTQVGAAAPIRLAAVHCATDRQVQQFVSRVVRPKIGSQQIIPQAEFAGSPGNEGTGSVWFGQTNSGGR
jgi:hypothetical protein